MASIASIILLILAGVEALRKNYVIAKESLFATVRLLEYAAGNLICIFNDRVGLHWMTDAQVHLKFYALATQPLHLRQRAFKEWFLSPIEQTLDDAKKLTDNLRAGVDSLPPSIRQLKFS